MKNEHQAVRSGTGAKRIAPEELEKKILERLDLARVLNSRELAAELGRSPGTVRDACRRLYEKSSLRLSMVPKYLYRFALTGDVLHQGNYPVVTGLVALANRASIQGGIRPDLKRIFAVLRQKPGLRNAFHQSYITRCEKAAMKAGGEAALRDRISIRPFRSLVTYWWPRSLEALYVKPVGRIMDGLDKRRIQVAAGRLRKLTSEVNGELAGNPSRDASKALKAVHASLDRYAEVEGCLEDSGARDLLKNRDDQLTSIASRDTIPAKDLDYVSPEELDDCLDLVHGVPSNRRQPSGDKEAGMTRSELIDLLREAAAAGAAGGRPPSSGKEDRGWRKWLFQSLKLGIGGSLVFVDLSLGFGPLGGAFQSAGGGQIGVALSVASSIHAGAKTALEAMHKMLSPNPK